MSTENRSEEVAARKAEWLARFNELSKRPPLESKLLGLRFDERGLTRVTIRRRVSREVGVRGGSQP